MRGKIEFFSFIGVVFTLIVAMFTVFGCEPDDLPKGTKDWEYMTDKKKPLSVSGDIVTRAAIMEALLGNDPENELVKAVRSEVERLSLRFDADARAQKKIPSNFAIEKPRSMIEHVALEIFQDTMKAIPNGPRIVVLDYAK